MIPEWFYWIIGGLCTAAILLIGAVYHISIQNDKELREQLTGVRQELEKRITRTDIVLFLAPVQQSVDLMVKELGRYRDKVDMINEKLQPLLILMQKQLERQERIDERKDRQSD